MTVCCAGGFSFKKSSSIVTELCTCSGGDAAIGCDRTAADEDEDDAAGFRDELCAVELLLLELFTGGSNLSLSRS